MKYWQHCSCQPPVTLFWHGIIQTMIRVEERWGIFFLPSIIQVDWSLKCKISRVLEASENCYPGPLSFGSTILQGHAGKEERWLGLDLEPLAWAGYRNRELLPRAGYKVCRKKDFPVWVVLLFGPSKKVTEDKVTTPFDLCSHLIAKTCFSWGHSTESAYAKWKRKGSERGKWVPFCPTDLQTDMNLHCPLSNILPF